MLQLRSSSIITSVVHEIWSTNRQNPFCGVCVGGVGGGWALRLFVSLPWLQTSTTNVTHVVVPRA